MRTRAKARDYIWEPTNIYILGRRHLGPTGSGAANVAWKNVVAGFSPRSQFSILNSQFSILNSQFSISLVISNFSILKFISNWAVDISDFRINSRPQDPPTPLNERSSSSTGTRRRRRRLHRWIARAGCTLPVR